MRLSTYILCIFTMFGFAQYAKAENNGVELGRIFLGMCLGTLPDLDRIEAAARFFEWQLLEGDLARIVAPADPKAEWKGWFVTQESAPSHFFGISTGPFDGATMVACTVANPKVKVTELLSFLNNNLDFKKLIADDFSAGQRNRFWSVDVDGKQAYISLLDAERMGQPGFSITGMMKVKK